MEDPAGGIEVVSKATLGKCSIDITFWGNVGSAGEAKTWAIIRLDVCVGGDSLECGFARLLHSMSEGLG
jgi:hypothetical protein